MRQRSGHNHHHHHPHHPHHHHHHHHLADHEAGASERGAGHNSDPAPAQWQTPHLADGPGAPEPEAVQDADLLERAFRDGLAAAPDPTNFLRLAGVPFVGRRADGTVLRLLRVEQSASLDVGALTPHLGGGSFRYDPLPAAMTSRRDEIKLVYFDGESTVPLTLHEARALSDESVP